MRIWIACFAICLAVPAFGQCANGRCQPQYSPPQSIQVPRTVYDQAQLEGVMVPQPQAQQQVLVSPYVWNGPVARSWRAFWSPSVYVRSAPQPQRQYYYRIIQRGGGQ